MTNSQGKGLISVIIPNFNQAQYVKTAIQSVLKQTYPNYEIIVVDDGSTDNSQEILSEYEGKINYIWQENKGLAGARNTGILAASGEFIGLLDADDEWLPTYLEKMMVLAEQFPDTSVYYCGAKGMDSGGNDLPQKFGRSLTSVDQIYQSLLRANFLIPSTITMRRSVILEFGLFDQALRSCEDWDLWLRILPEKKLMGIDECLVRYRIHEKSLSTNPSGMQNATRLVIEKHFGEDDGMWNTWSQEKRRAYGGVYRYHVLTSIQRQADWGVGAEYMSRALQIDPSLAMDVDLFYEIALGAQPSGFRGTSQMLTLEDNIAKIEKFLSLVFNTFMGLDIKPYYRKTYGTAYFAIGLLAYNCRYQLLVRKFLFRAIYYRPELLFDRRTINNILKSYLGNSVLDWIRLVKRTK